MEKESAYQGKGLCVSMIISLLGFWVFFYCLYGTELSNVGILQWIMENNIKAYAIGLILFAVIFAVTFLLTANILRKLQKNQVICIKYKHALLMLAVIVICGMVFFFNMIFVAQYDEIGFSDGTVNDFPQLLVFVCLFVLLTMVFRLYRKEYDTISIIEYGIYAYAIIVTFMGTFIVNPFSAPGIGGIDFTMSQTYDITSVTETIFNVLDGVPFTYDTTSLYGHYGLLYAIPLFLLNLTKTVRGGVEQVMMMIALAACVAQLFVIYVIRQFAPKKWIACILVLASVIRTTYTYPAISPIRTFFPLCLCALLTYIYKHGNGLNYRRMIAAFLLCTFAVLSNVETGAGCVLGFLAFLICHRLQSEKFFSKKMLKTYLFSALFGLFSIIAAIVIVNLYNFSCGTRSFVFHSFFYPYNKGGFALDVLRCNMPIGNHVCVYMLTLLLGSLAWGIYHTKLLRRNQCEFMKEAPLLAGTATTGIITFAYYVNEARWGCKDISFQIVVELMAILLGLFWRETRWDNKMTKLPFNKIVRTAICLLLLGMVTVYSYRSIYDPVRISARNRAGAYDTSVMKEDIAHLAYTIPKETYGVGQAIHIVYHELGWDNHAKYRDTTSIGISSEESLEKLIDEVMQHDSFLISAFVDWCDLEIRDLILERDSSYQLVETVYVCDNAFEYYVRSR